MTIKYGHPRKPTLLTAKNMRRERHWQTVGTENRFEQIYLRSTASRPIEFLRTLGKKQPKVMILGPGVGEDTVKLYRSLTAEHLDPKIDTFGLTNSLSRAARRIIVRDYSINMPLEMITPRVPEHQRLISALIGKYDLIVGALSVGIHTRYPAYNVFASSLMLSPGGKAFIEVRDYRDKKKIIEVVKKMVGAYNRANGTNFQFDLENINFTGYNRYLEITRIQ